MEICELKGYTIQDSGEKQSKKRLAIVKKSTYFNVMADIKLLQQVLQFNPFDDQEAWNVIVDNMNDGGDSYTMRQIKNRVTILINKFHQENLNSFNKTGTEEQWGERTTLITNVIEMIEGTKITTDTSECGTMSSNSSSTFTVQEKHAAAAAEDRKAVATLYIEEDSAPEAPVVVNRSKLKRSCLDDQTDRKVVLEHEYRMRKLELDHQNKMREHELQEKRLQQEAKASEQQNHIMIMIQQQQQTILNMLDKIIVNK